MTGTVEAVTSTRRPSRKRVTRNPKRKRGGRALDLPDDDERDEAALGPGTEPKSDS